MATYKRTDLDFLFFATGFEIIAPNRPQLSSAEMSGK